MSEKERELERQTEGGEREDRGREREREKERELIKAIQHPIISMLSPIFMIYVLIRVYCRVLHGGGRCQDCSSILQLCELHRCQLLTWDKLLL